MTPYKMARRLFCALLLFLLATPNVAPAADKIAECTVDGTVYKRIFEVHETADGRIGIMYRVGGITVDRSKLSQEFLDSWGVGTASVSKAASAASAPAGNSNADWVRARQAEELDAAIRAGMIRRVGNTIYDVRKMPAGWESIARAKVLSISQKGAVLEVPDRPENSRLVVVANLPMIQDQNQTVSALVKLIGFEKRTLKKIGEVTVAVYDYGEVCDKDEVPVEILSAGVIEGSSEAWSRGRTHRAASADNHDASRSGSGFFISPDGYLLTSYHVVADATKVVVRHAGQNLAATVTQVDRTNDLALLKVAGNDFKWLPLAAQAKVGLGESVFTIGYPNPSLQGKEPKYSEGTISGLDGFQDDPREYQISLAVQPGNSGGPVCNASGEVVGVVRSSLNAGFALVSSGSLPQSVNYAVKSSYALQLMQSANLGRDFSMGNPFGDGRSREIIRERAQDSVAMVLVFE
jgi:S1-C subfamily serine protease